MHKSPPEGKGRYQARIVRASGEINASVEVSAALALRSLAFATQGSDRDKFDDICDHLLVDDLQSGALVCCARLLRLQSGAEIGRSYSAQFYDLAALSTFQGRMLELGRFCIHPAHTDPDILRVAWAAIADHVDEFKIEMMFGCSSFTGTETAIYADTFALLRARHMAPEHWRPRVKAPEVHRYGACQLPEPDIKQALRMMPPLLRTYLMMGGWVSDHAVVDRQMQTLHVFTGLEISAIPAARKRLLRRAGG